ncbi:MAG: segregation/condensation protein A, partial [Kiritimatiellaeota bacterium]|nr:segregation/condensation protein A [Kiritimatiellota bacterium]
MQQQLLPDDYKVNLEVFEGPLDLLLYLIRKDELDIHDIPIGRIADQYQQYIETMRILDLNMAGEFIVMAATLALIKSRMLLPADESAAGDDSADEGKDPRWDLVRQLVAYKKYKDAADDLLRREFDRQNIFSPAAPTVPEEDLAEEKTLTELNLFDLIGAFNEVLSRAEIEP